MRVGDFREKLGEPINFSELNAIIGVKTNSLHKTYKVTPSWSEMSGQSGKLHEGRVPFQSPEELHRMGTW